MYDNRHSHERVGVALEHFRLKESSGSCCSRLGKYEGYALEMAYRYGHSSGLSNRLEYLPCRRQSMSTGSDRLGRYQSGMIAKSLVCSDNSLEIV